MRKNCETPTAAKPKALALLAGLLAVCAACAPASHDPSGTWLRHRDVFSCDWEGGLNEGMLTFARNGNFSESLRFHDHSDDFTTSATGHWSLRGEMMTLDLTEMEGKNERSDASEHMRLLFQTELSQGALRLTLTEIVHDDDHRTADTVELPAAERCTAVFEPASRMPGWKRMLHSVMSSAS